jgi:hypothetical protein
MEVKIRRVKVSCCPSSYPCPNRGKPKRREQVRDAVLVRLIEDGMSIPKLLAELWPKAVYQRCVFHVLQDINGDVLDAARP